MHPMCETLILSLIHISTNIESTITIYLLNTDTEKVLNKSKNDLDIHSFGIIKTAIIPIRTDLSQGVQMILINPYYTIIKRDVYKRQSIHSVESGLITANDCPACILLPLYMPEN